MTDSRGPRRGQLSLPALEAAIGVVLILSITGGFLMGAASPGSAAHVLDRHAIDTLRVLQVASGDGSPPRIRSAIATEAAFNESRSALIHRLGRVIPPELLYRVRTPHGTLGYPPPSGSPIGRASLSTVHGRVVVEVWHV